MCCCVLPSDVTQASCLCRRAGILPRVGNARLGSLRDLSGSPQRVRPTADWKPKLPSAAASPLSVIGAFFVLVLAIGSTMSVLAAASNAARVTQAIHKVELLAPNAAPRPASINGNVRPGTAVRTGSDSRAELAFTDRTLARLGANTVFIFGEGEFDLATGSILLYVPKSSRGGRIDTAVATAAGSSFTAMAEYRRKSWIKFMILEGHATVSLKHHPGETRALRAGQMLIARADATKLPEAQDIDLSKLIKNSLLITGFPPLPNLNLILREAENQQNLPPSTPPIDPTGMNARDQRAATERERTKPGFNR
jgi:hypothetical protein